MQLGFAMLCAGSVRAKNSMNIMKKIISKKLIILKKHNLLIVIVVNIKYI
jgi:ammonia channel protein AmtB